MSFVGKKLVTVVCEAQLETDLVEDFKKLKIRGYTICEAKGKGDRGLRAGDWEQNRNIRIEIVCGQREAEKIMNHLRKEYYENYAIISYMLDVKVMRGDKFT